MPSFAAHQPSGQTKFFLYVGSYTNEIHAYDFDASNGQMKPIGPMGQVDSPSWIGVDPEFKHLFAVSEAEKKQGAVTAFSINRENASLRKLNEQPSGGLAPCHLTTDRTGRMLMVANYTSGGVSAFPIQETGSLGEMTSLMTVQGHGPNAQRQEGPHAHETVVSSDNRFLYVPDLGLDEIRLYRIDPATAKLTPNDPPFVKQDPGFGPRHIAFSPDESFAYVMNELKSQVSVFKHDKETGNLTKIQDVSSLPPGYSGENGPAEILVDATGKFVYATNRGADTIAVFGVDPEKGTLQLIQTVPAQGKDPRGLAIEPTGHYLFVGNQKTDNFAVYHVDSQSGKLTPTGQIVHQGSPVSFVFVPQK